MNHAHVNAHHHITLRSGGHYEVCDCGASRKVDSTGKPELDLVGGRFNAKNDVQGWHTCDLCTSGAKS